MANEEHLAKLQEGVGTWNQWRKENPSIEDPDLQGVYWGLVNLSRANLSKVNLSTAQLFNANFEYANLSRANLSGANLNGANLDYADLKYANLEGTTLYRASLKYAKLDYADLEYANFEGTNLEGATLHHSKISDTNFNCSKLNRSILEYLILLEVKLEEINLEGANLEGMKFYGFNISGFNLSDTHLCGANLNKVQALATNFKGANLTGACIEDWNINNKTNLQNVKCDYIYLREIYSEEPQPIFADRVPHDPDKIFAPGEFTKLFQQVLETVDLIFSEGIEWAAFLESFQQLQAKIKSDELSIQAIEKKSGGTFIVRVEVPESANKAEIQKYIEKEYEAKLKIIEATYQKQLQAKDEELIKAYQEKSNDLLEVVKIMASMKQTTNINNNPNMSTGNTYNQSGNIGIGHMSGGTIAGNAKIAGIINEAAPQDLAQAAAEIQQLLEQLSQTYPTKTTSEKMTVGVKLTEELENNPTRWQKPIKVIKAMGVEALAEAVDNPIFNIAKAGIEAALESN